MLDTCGRMQESCGTTYHASAGIQSRSMRTTILALAVCVGAISCSLSGNFQTNFQTA
jgi:hypothetical protein